MKLPSPDSRHGTLTSTLRYLYVTCTLPVRYLRGNLDPGSLGKLPLPVEVTDSCIEGNLQIHDGNLKPTGLEGNFQSPKLRFHFFVIKKFTRPQQTWV